MLSDADITKLLKALEPIIGSYPERRDLLLGGLTPQIRAQLPLHKAPADQLHSDVRQLASLQSAGGDSALVPLLEALARDAGRPTVSAALDRAVRKARERPIDARIKAGTRALDHARRSGTAPDEIERLRADLLAIKRSRRIGPALEEGVQLGDRFELIERLGSGGFATVWRAWDIATRQHVALKALHPHLAADPGRRTRFERGARAMARLEHPHIVRVLTPAAEDGGHVYFAQALIEGHDLRAGVVNIWRVVHQIAEALGHAHASDICHRDVTPANILVAADGSAHLTDFDLVIDPDTTAGTRTGALGTVGFQPPEALGDPDAYGPGSDVYSLAMVALYLLSQRMLRPERMFAPQARLDACERAVSSPLANSILRRALSEDPGRRFRDGTTFAREIARLLAGETTLPLRPLLIRIAPRLPAIPNPLLVAQTPVTQGQFEAVMGFNPSHFGGDPQRPVERVTHREALTYCRTLSKSEGLDADAYRLLSYDEWSSLAGLERYPDAIPAIEQAWHADNAGGSTRPVGQRAPNSLGLADLWGNVGEFVTDRDDRGLRVAGGDFRTPPARLGTDGTSVVLAALLSEQSRSVETGFRIVRRAPIPIETQPCDPDSGEYLVHYARGGYYETLWLAADPERGSLRLRRRWPYLVLTAGAEVWVWWESMRWADTTDGHPSDPETHPPVRLTPRWSLVRARDARETVVNQVNDFGGYSGGGGGSARVLAVVGPRLFVRVYNEWQGGPHQWVTRLPALDLASPELTDGAADLMQAAPPASWWRPKAFARALELSHEPLSSRSGRANDPAAWNFRPTGLLPRFDPDGRLGADWQITHDTYGAASDGSWGRYTASVIIEAPEMPPQFAPWVEPPPVVEAALRHRRIGFLGWNRLSADVPDLHGLLDALPPALEFVPPEF